MSSAHVVTGTLVEEPSRSLRHRIKIVAFVYLSNSMWSLMRYTSTRTPALLWLRLAVSTFFLALWLPFCGLRASEKPGSGKLALFSGVQGCLGCWNLFAFSSLAMFVSTVILICQTCAPVFAAGNATCTLDPENVSSIPEEQPLVIRAYMCEQSNPSVEHVVTGLLCIAMSVASFSTAFHGRKTGKAKMVHVVTVEPTSANPLHIPIIPEDAMDSRAIQTSDDSYNDSCNHIYGTASGTDQNEENA